MARDAHGLEIPPRTRWKEKFERLQNDHLRSRRDLGIALKKLEQAEAEIKTVKTKMKILRNQIQALRAGQNPLPLEEVA